MAEMLLRESVIRLYRSILGRQIGDEELSIRVNKALRDTVGNDAILGLVDELLNSEEFSRRFGTNPSFYDVTDADVFYAYKFFLGRFPESKDVYLQKRKIAGSAALVDQIVASDEFKSNKILKSLISIRRKPKGFEELQASSSRNKKNILIISGCQGRMIADLIQSGGRFGFVENVFLSNDQLHKFINNKGEGYEILFAWADIIYTQKHQVYKILQDDTSLAQKARLIPLVEYAGLQPDQCSLTDARSGAAIVGPMGEYQSIILTAAYYAGLDVDSAVRAFNSVVYAKFGYNEIAAVSKDRFLSQQESTSYPLGKMLNRWEASGKWMRTVNHPKKMVLADLVRFALDKEGISPIPNFDEYVVDDLADNADWPEYGGSGPQDSTSGSINLIFKRPKALSPIANAAEFLTLREFTEMFYRSMEGYPREIVLCYRQSVKVEMDEFIDYLRQEFAQS